MNWVVTYVRIYHTRQLLSHCVVLCSGEREMAEGEGRERKTSQGGSTEDEGRERTQGERGGRETQEDP